MQGHHSHQWGPLPGNCLAARIADLTPDLQVLLSWLSTGVSFHSQLSFSVSFFHVSLGLLGPCLPSTGLDRLQSSGEYQCAVCHTGVGNKSIYCNGCKLWMHKKCSRLQQLTPNLDYRCARCMGNAHPIDGRPQSEVQVRPDKLEVVACLCYLGDMLSAGGGCEIMVTTRVITAWKKFRELLTVLTSCHLSYKTPSHVYSSCMGIRLTSARGPGLYHRSWPLSFLYLPSIPSPPSLLFISRASWHIPLGSQQWWQDHLHIGPPREHQPKTHVTMPPVQGTEYGSLVDPDRHLKLKAHEYSILF